MTQLLMNSPNLKFHRARLKCQCSPPLVQTTVQFNETLFLSTTNPKHFKSSTQPLDPKPPNIPSVMDLNKRKSKENSSLKINRNKTSKNQTPSKPLKKFQNPPKDHFQIFTQKESSEYQTVKEDNEKFSKVMKSRTRLFSRQHFINKKKTTQICDLTTGASTYSSKTPEKYIMGDFNEIQKIGQQLVNTSPFSSNSHYARTEWKEVIPHKCICQKWSAKVNSCHCHVSTNETMLAPSSKTEELKVRHDFSVFSKKECRSIELFKTARQEETAQPPKCQLGQQCNMEGCNCKKSKSQN